MLGFEKRIHKELFCEGVKHCTFDPDGPGVVRIHLIPPVYNSKKQASYIAILNGYYLLPLGYSWAVMLAYFIDGINETGGKNIDYKTVFENTVKKTARIYPLIGKKNLALDLEEMLDIIFDIARGGKPDVYIEKMSMRAYAQNMSAPHRADLMISAMTDQNGAWQCNQKCIFCYAAGCEMSATRELTTDRWKTVIDRLRQANVPMLTFTGGEPTKRDDLIELIDYSRWFVTRLNTNGILLTRELTDALRAASLDSVQVTLYSYDADIHNTLTGGGCFEKTVEGIKNAVSSGLDISINTPLCRKNADYTKTLEFIFSLGVSFVTVSGLICTGSAENSHDEYDLTEDELFDIVKSAREYCDKNGMEIDFTSPGLISKERLEGMGMNVPYCGAALSNIGIAPDGSVIPCQSWLDGKNAGNILTDDFCDIWHNKLFTDLRQMSEDKALRCPFRGGESWQI